MSMIIDKIAVKSAKFQGSVHQKGNVTVTIEDKYGNIDEEMFITVSDGFTSDRLSGEESLIVKNKHDFWDLPKGVSLPVISDPNVEEPIDNVETITGSKFHPAKVDVDINTLVILPVGNDEILNNFRNYGYKAVNNLNIRGSIHENGKIVVNIENLIMMDEKKYDQ